MVWTGFPYWDLSLFEIHLGQSLLLSFLQEKANLFIIIILNLFLAYEILKISKLYIIPLGKMRKIFAELDIPHVITPESKNNERMT